MAFPHSRLAGLWYVENHTRKYLPQVDVAAHVSLQTYVSRTTLTQTFENPTSGYALKEVKYSFPLYEGVSVVGFTCSIGDRVIEGVVKEKEKARQDYTDAVQRGESAALLEQVSESADVFMTTVGNVPSGTIVCVEITFLGELKHDAEADGIRYMLPTFVAPRYGDLPPSMLANDGINLGKGTLDIVVDVQIPDNHHIKSIQSPSHPISVSLGTISTASDAQPALNKASATLSLGKAELDKDFVVHVVSPCTSEAVAVLEEHPTIPGHRAMMCSLVPRFGTPQKSPETIFVCDRSGSMGGQRIRDLKTALQLFLKSLPFGSRFNICSFGSTHSFLWNKSKVYSEEVLAEALRHVQSFDANMGGTEIYTPLKATFENKGEHGTMEVFLLTDGDIWALDRTLDLINTSVEKSKGAVRLFSLGIGSGASTALVEGVARAGGGFAQFVADGEKMNKKIMRMLKASLGPHMTECNLDVEYEKVPNTDDDEFELVEKVADCLTVKDCRGKDADNDEKMGGTVTISLMDPSYDPDAPIKNTSVDQKYDSLPTAEVPRFLQAPYKVPQFYALHRADVYLLYKEDPSRGKIKAVTFRCKIPEGELKFTVDVKRLTEPGTTVHQLAARKAIRELEEGRGWLHHAKDAQNKLLKEKYADEFAAMVEREAVRMGVEFQVANKWCSFVAVEKTPSNGKEETVVDADTSVRVEPQREDPNAIFMRNQVVRTAGGPMKNSVRRMFSSSKKASSSGGLYSAQACSIGATPAFTAQAFSTGAPPPPPVPGSQVGGGRSPSSTNVFGSPPGAGAAPASSSLFGSTAAGPVPNLQGVMSQQSSLFGRARSTDTRSAETSTMAANINKVLERGEKMDSLADHSAAAKAFRRDSRRIRSDDDDDTGVKSARGVGFAMAAQAPPAPSKRAFRPTGDALDDLVALQGFDGSWPAGSPVYATIGVEDTMIVGALQTSGVQSLAGLLAEDKADARATAAVLVFLKVKLASEEEVWEMLAEKAWGYLVREVLGQGVQVEDVVGALKGLF